MEIVVKSRHCTPSEAFRETAQEKLSRLDRFGQPFGRIEVELSRERAPRQSSTCERVELTLVGKGPVVRGEADAQDPVAALDLAISKVEARLRKLAGRRKVSHSHGGNHPVPTMRHTQLPEVPDLLGPQTADAPLAIREAGELIGRPAPAAPTTLADDPDGGAGSSALDDGAPAGRTLPPVDDGTSGEGPFIVREKFHSAQPMTRDQALEQMELVGHDFFLYCCKETGLPSVVYRRRAYDYGVLHLAVQS